MQTIGLNLGTSTRTTVNVGASSAKGSWATLGTASAAFKGIVLNLGEYDTNNADYLFFDIRLAGTTTVLTDLQFRSKSPGNHQEMQVFLPISGASGNTIEIRGSTADTVSRNVSASAILVDTLPFTPASTSTTYGKSGTTGTILDAGATAHTESAKVELTTSGGISHEADYFILGCCLAGDNVLASSSSYIVRLYTGASGATDTGIAVYFVADTTKDQVSQQHYGLFVNPSDFPSGTRVWASIQSTNNTADDRALSAILHAFNLSSSGGGGGSTFINRGIRSGGAL